MFLLTLLLIFLYSLNIILSQECTYQKHKFYILPLIKESNISVLKEGLHKYDYILVLETNPLNEDKYHLILSVTFPININIELSPDIIYSFESLKKFCILDLTKEKRGKYINIQGKLSEYSTDNLILSNIWIKVEKIILFTIVDSIERNNNIFYLISKNNEDDHTEKYYLLKKMSQSPEQFFQIVSVKINENINQNYFCANDNELTIGTEFTILGTSEKDQMLRNGLQYNAYNWNTQKNYVFQVLQNFICITYSKKSYEEKCFESQVDFNIYNFISEVAEKKESEVIEMTMKKINKNKEMNLRNLENSF